MIIFKDYINNCGGDGELVTNNFLPVAESFRDPGAPILCTHKIMAAPFNSRT